MNDRRLNVCLQKLRSYRLDSRCEGLWELEPELRLDLQRRANFRIALDASRWFAQHSDRSGLQRTLMTIAWRRFTQYCLAAPRYFGSRLHLNAQLQLYVEQAEPMRHSVLERACS